MNLITVTLASEILTMFWLIRLDDRITQKQACAIFAVFVLIRLDEPNNLHTCNVYICIDSAPAEILHLQRFYTCRDSTPAEILHNVISKKEIFPLQYITQQ